MSKMSEKVAYLKGLAEGMGVTGESREDKLMLAVIDALEAGEGYTCRCHAREEGAQ